MDNRKVIDLTLFLSPDTCSIISGAGLKAKKSKNEIIEAEHITWSILNNDTKTRNILQNSGQYMSLFTDIETKLNQLSKWRMKPIKIDLSDDVKKALMDSLTQSSLLKEQFVSPLALFMALTKENKTGMEYNALLKVLSLTEGVQINTNTSLGIPDGVEDITSKSPTDLDAYIDRPAVTDQIIRALYKTDKKNILLVGNDGIGKNSFAYILAKRSFEEDSVFSGSRIFMIDAQKISLSSIPGYINSLKELSENNPDQNKKNILFLKNLEITQNNGNNDFGAASSFIESLVSTKLWGIIPIDYNQHQILLKSYPSIVKTSEAIFIEEPDLDTAFKMIQAKYKNNTDIPISDELIHDSINLARRFVHDKYLPENALSIIDEAISQARIDRSQTITTDKLKTILSQKTGIPINDISAEEATQLQNLDNLLMASVIGQDEAVEAVAKTIKRSRAGLKDPKRPIGSFLFIGPSGTGKTQLAKALSKAIYKDENAMIRIDMSEYTDSHTVDRLIGAPPGYVGYEEGGQLTNKVLKKPYSLILLDEVEKANPKVFDIFLQVLDDGRLTDGQGKTVDFKNTIIIMTSNLVEEDNLNKFFRPEFLNRIDQIIHFKPLNVEIGKSITKLFIKDLQARLAEKNINIEVSDDVITKIATDGITEKFGARPLKRLVEEKIEDPIVEKIISGEVTPGQTIQWTHID